MNKYQIPNDNYDVLNSLPFDDYQPETYFNQIPNNLKKHLVKRDDSDNKEDKLDQILNRANLAEEQQKMEK